MSLKGKVAIITGASSGIGRTTALDFAKEGATVVVAARRIDLLNELVIEIEKKYGPNKAFAVQYDATKEADNKRLVEETVKRYGRLDVAFNNAGILRGMGKIENVTEEDVDAMFNVNIKGVFFAMKYEIPAMLETGNNGSIINNGSVVGHTVSRSISNVALYSGTKAFLHSLSQSAALENAGKIRVNVIAPGPTINDGEASAMIEELGKKSTLVGRAASTEEISHWVTLLASDKSSFVTGSVFLADGGVQLQ